MARKGYPSDTQDQYMLRFPAGMRDRIRAEAERNGRSMNAEIIMRLEESFGTLPTSRELADFVQQDARYKEWMDPILAEIRKAQPDSVRRSVEFLDFLGLDVTADIREWKRGTQGDEASSMSD